jgi:hypothetical protein
MHEAVPPTGARGAGWVQQHQHEPVHMPGAPRRGQDAATQTHMTMRPDDSFNFKTCFKLRAQQSVSTYLAIEPNECVEEGDLFAYPIDHRRHVIFFSETHVQLRSAPPYTYDHHPPPHFRFNPYDDNLSPADPTISPSSHAADLALPPPQTTPQSIQAPPIQKKPNSTVPPPAASRGQGTSSDLDTPTPPSEDALASVAVACEDAQSARAWRRNRQRLLRRASSSTRSVATVTELCIKGEAEVAWVPSAVTIGGVRSPIPVPGGQCDRTGAKEAGTEMHPEDELLKQEDFRTSWGIERLPPGWYRSEARRRWGSSSDGDVYDDDDRDSVGSY